MADYISLKLNSRPIYSQTVAIEYLWRCEDKSDQTILGQSPDLVEWMMMFKQVFGILKAMKRKFTYY